MQKLGHTETGFIIESSISSLNNNEALMFILLPADAFVLYGHQIDGRLGFLFLLRHSSGM